MNDVCRTTILDYTILLLLVPFRADAALPIFQILYASVDIVRTLLLTWCYIAYGSTGTRVYVADRLPVSIVPAAPPTSSFLRSSRLIGTSGENRRPPNCTTKVRIFVIFQGYCLILALGPFRIHDTLKVNMMKLYGI